MRIVLINPPFFQVHGGFKDAAKIGSSYPPMGLLYLSGKLRSEGHKVHIIDVSIEHLYSNELIGIILDYKPDLIGITATTPLYREACKIAKAIKSKNDVPIVIGGYHVTILQKPVMADHTEFDYAVLGEGEITFSKLIRCLEQGGDPANIPGLLIRSGGNVEFTGIRPMVNNLDELPYPAHDLINKKLYLWTAPRKGVVPITIILTKRGCPFHCTFCSQKSMFTRKVRYRSIDNVLDELEEITKVLGFHHILIQDDTLVIKRERMLQLCEGIHQRGLKFTWEGLARANLVDKELINIMAEAGLVRISFGIESGDDEILQTIQKGVTKEQMRTAYKWCEEAGIETRGSAIIGHPGETRKSAWKTILFVRSITHLDQLLLNIMVPYPGTEVHRLASKGEAGYRLLSADYENYVRYANPVLEVNDLDAKTLVRMQSIGLWLFYLTPRRIIYNLRRAGLTNGIRLAIAFLKGQFINMLSDGTFLSKRIRRN